MGLAAKLAASQGGQPPYPGGPPGQGPPPSLQPGGAQKPGGAYAKASIKHINHTQEVHLNLLHPSDNMHKFYQDPRLSASYPVPPTSSPQPPYHSHPSYNTAATSNNSFAGPPPPRKAAASPQPPYSSSYTQPQYGQVPSPQFPGQNTSNHSPNGPYGAAPFSPYPYGQQSYSNGPTYAPQQYQQAPSGIAGYGGYPAQGGQGGYPPQSSPGYPPQSSPGYPPQSSPGYPPQGGQQGYPPQGAQQGYAPHGGQQGYPPQGAQQYGSAPSMSASPQEVQKHKQALLRAVQEKGLQAFYQPNSPTVDQMAQRGAQQVERIARDWEIHQEVANDIVRLALYDIVLLIDDSGSMRLEENGRRIVDLKLLLQRVSYAASMFDDDGVQIRFLNSQVEGNGIRNEQQIQDLVSRVKFSGLTMVGTMLQEKILEPLVLGPARGGRLRKPVLVITITDGQPVGESLDHLSNVIKHVSNTLGSTQYGRGALALQFAQVGNDSKAQEFLSKLDEDPGIGDFIDCISNVEFEDKKWKDKGEEGMTGEMWLVKLLLGSIDPQYDEKDETSNVRQQPGAYGASQDTFGQQYSGGYGQQANPGQQQSGYPQPPPMGQSGYGQQGAYAPQQGGYGQQQGYSQPHGGYSRPPGQAGQGYPPQQGGGYGSAPPPPPRY